MQLISCRQAAILLGINEEKIRYWADNGLVHKYFKRSSPSRFFLDHEEVISKKNQLTEDRRGTNYIYKI